MFKLNLEKASAMFHVFAASFGVWVQEVIPCEQQDGTTAFVAVIETPEPKCTMQFMLRQFGDDVAAATNFGSSTKTAQAIYKVDTNDIANSLSSIFATGLVEEIVQAAALKEYAGSIN